MAYNQLIMLAPCHGLEDFPLYHTGEEAGSLLACWTSLWHPLFINSSSSLPRIERCDYPPQDIDKALMILPSPCESELDPELPSEADAKEATLIHGQTSRSDILRQALQPYGDQVEKLDKELVRDFLAFGFAYLQVEVLTQQMRYASSIDENKVKRDLQAAAAALIEGDADLCREKLTVCHDALTDERNHYYPVDVYLIDLTLLATAEATLGRALDRQLNDGVAQNLMASGEAIEKLAELNPAAIQVIRSGLMNDTISIVGGEYDETPLQLMSLDSAADQMARGTEAYRKHIGEQPMCFARRRNGFYPSLAEAIRNAGYKSALHLKFDEGQMPESSQGRTNWQLYGRDMLETYARSPLDASLHETFLNLPTYLSDTMDSDHVAARLLIHWPGHAAPWYQDLRRCARYGTAIGKFVTLKEFFAEAADYSTKDSFQPDDYVYPTLKQAVSTEDSTPISKWPTYWSQQTQRMATEGLSTVNACHDFGETNAPEEKTITQTVLNPMSFARRIKLLTRHNECATGPSVYATAPQQNGAMATLVDVPAMGFATVKFNGDTATDGPDLADVETLTLQNEFFQATFDQDTGALRSLRDYKSRKTRLSQQVAFRITLPKSGQAWVDRQAPVGYSVMAADSIEFTQNGKIFAELTTKGRMLALNGEVVGEFEQRFQVTRGSRVLVIEAEIKTIDDLILDDPWDSYYAFRFAFGDETAIMHAGTRLQSHDVSRRRFEAPLFVDIDCGKSNTTILTGGLPFHRRSSLSQLDTLLSVHGESAKRFRVGIGVELPSKMRSAIDFMLSTEPAHVARASGLDNGWFLHIDAKNVIVSSWEPLANGEGIRLCMVETEQRKSRARVRSFKSWSKAVVINQLGEEIKELSIEDGAAIVQVEPHAYTELRLLW